MIPGEADLVAGIMQKLHYEATALGVFWRASIMESITSTKTTS